MHEHDVREGTAFPEPASVAGFVLTGSSASVTERAPWMLRFEGYLRACVALGVPMLGVCFGHQILAQALGGAVAKNPLGREIGTREVTVGEGVEDPIFSGLGSTFHVSTTHVDTVAKLPAGARVLARTALEPHAAYALPKVRCVQFHPEIDGDAMRAWVELRRPLLENEGLDYEAIRSAARESPAGGAILRNFVTHFVIGDAR